MSLVKYESKNSLPNVVFLVSMGSVIEYTDYADAGHWQGVDSSLGAGSRANN